MTDWSEGGATVMVGDALTRLRELADASVHMVCTSPPYWGLRDYGTEPQTWPDGWVGSLGLEPTPEMYVCHLVEVFREVRRVLRADGTLWLVLGDSYAHGGNGSRDPERWSKQSRNNDGGRIQHAKRAGELKSKDLAMLPAEAALALRHDGWWLRKDIIWHKPDPMPESVTDRPTTAHEHVFLLARSERYFYDAAAVREPDVYGDHPRRVLHRPEPSGGLLPPHLGIRTTNGRQGAGRNQRDVWTIATQPYREAHFATFPEELARRCIAGGSPIDGTVLDPFAGSGTTLAVAKRLGRRAIGVELQADYLPLIQRRVRYEVHQPGLGLVTEEPEPVPPAGPVCVRCGASGPLRKYLTGFYCAAGCALVEV